MPLYDYKCKSCDRVQEWYCSIDNLGGEVPCEKCNKPMHRLIGQRVTVSGDVDFVTDNITGKPLHVSSKRQLRELCKRNNIEPIYGKGWE